MTNIIAIDYSMATQSMDIFFSGCNMGKHCPGCHNAEAWDFNVGKDWKQWIFQINDNVKKFGPMIKRIFIIGLRSSMALAEFLEFYLNLILQNVKTVGNGISEQY